MGRIALIALLVLPPLLGGQVTLEISGHDPNTPFRPGETIVVTAKTEETCAGMFLMGDKELKTAQMLKAPPYRFLVQIPSDIVAGLFQLVAMGCKPGDWNDVGRITIDVEPVWPPGDEASHLVNDAPGVSVDTGGVPMVHRSAIPYPREIFEQGIGGTAVVEVTPGWDGHVQGIQYLSGPEALRKETIKAVLLWRFNRKVGQKPRQIKINFDPVEAERSVGLNPAGDTKPVGLPSRQWELVIGHTLKSIHVIGLSEEARNALLKQLPTVGEKADRTLPFMIINVVHNFDNDLSVWWKPEGTEFEVTITAPGFRLDRPEMADLRQWSIGDVRTRVPQRTPQRIRVPEAEQAAKLISKVEPAYPPGAQAAHIQGVIRLTIVLSKEGKVEMLQPLGGEPQLAIAAEEAVRQWKYAPTLIDGNPVEVVSEVEVEFFLPN